MSNITLSNIRPAPFRVWDLPLDEHDGGRQTVTMDVDPQGRRTTTCLVGAAACANPWGGETKLPQNISTTYVSNLQNTAGSMFIPPYTTAVGWSDANTVFPISNPYDDPMYIRNIDYYKDPRFSQLKNKDGKWSVYLVNPKAFQDHIITDCCMGKRYDKENDYACHLGRVNGKSRVISRRECDILVKQWCENPANTTKSGCECYNITDANKKKNIDALKKAFPLEATFYPVQYIPACKLSPTAYKDLNNEVFSSRALTINNIQNCNIAQGIKDTMVEIGGSQDSTAQSARCVQVGQDAKGNEESKTLVDTIIKEQEELKNEVKMKEFDDQTKELNAIAKTTEESSDAMARKFGGTIGGYDKKTVIMILILFVVVTGVGVGIASQVGGRPRNRIGGTIDRRYSLFKY